MSDFGRWMVLVALVLLLGAVGLRAEDAPGAVAGYLTEPDLRGDTVVFVSEGDLWSVSLAGGTARRLTRSDGLEASPRISPDGRWIAMMAEYRKNADVYVIPVEGGPPRRLTYHPDPDRPIGWLPDGSGVVFRSYRESPSWRPEAYVVPLSGGAPEKLPLGEVGHLSLSPDGRRAVFTQFALDYAHWDRYLGGLSEDLWLADLEAGTFRRLTDYPGRDAFPMWYGERIYFVSDRDGLAEIYCLDPATGDVRRVTHHEEYGIRHAAIDGSRIVFQRAGALFLLDLETESERPIPIRLSSDRRQTLPRYVAARDFLTDYDLSPDGERLLIEARGELLLVPLGKGPRRLLTRTPGVREFQAAWLPGGDGVVFCSDRWGGMELAELELSGGAPRALTSRTRVRKFPPRVSPDGRFVAYGDRAGILRVLERATGRTRVVAERGAWEITQYSWSPDSRWLAFAKPEANGFPSIFLYSLSEERVIRVTGPQTYDHHPVFDPGGRYLYFLSERDLEPLQGSIDFDAVFPHATRPYLVLLQAGRISPFDPLYEPPGEGTPAGSEGAGAGKKKDEATAPAVRIDEAGLMDRVLPFPLPGGEYKGLLALDEGILYLGRCLEETWRSTFSEEDAPRFELYSYELGADEPELVVRGVQSYSLSGDRRKLVVRRGKTLLVMDATVRDYAAAAGPDPEQGVEEVALRGLELRVDPPAEWRQILDEAWWLYRDLFWSRTMAGVDWEACRRRYAALLPLVGNRRELNQVLGEMIAELCTSHGYVGGGDVEKTRHASVGLLGADLAPAEDGFRITRLLRGDPWVPDARGPLSAPHLDVREGDVITAIDGVPLDGGTNPYRLLETRADEVVELTLRRGKRPPRTVALKTLADDHPLRYLDWVRRNRERVEQAGGGRVGYLHVPDMMGPGLVAFTRDYYAQLARPALIIDVRFNEGGYVSEMLVNRLQRQIAGFWRPRTGISERYPYWGNLNHIAVLINGDTSSDGEAFARGVQLLRLGTIVGARTWGGVIGIDDGESLIDGGYLAVPFLAWWDPERGWDVENQGVIPDVEVQIEPGHLVRGEDPQLERAVEVLLEAQAKDPRKQPTPPPDRIRSREEFPRRLEELERLLEGPRK
jgi:tricorn protease